MGSILIKSHKQIINNINKIYTHGASFVIFCMICHQTSSCRMLISLINNDELVVISIEDCLPVESVVHVTVLSIGL